MSQSLWNKTREWVEAHPRWTLSLAVLMSLGPFLAKPFNMDDPLFLWTASQIHAHPLDPYGFQVNWYGYPSPMWNVMQNPPLAAYYLALATKILGWREISLHGAFLLPALAVILGTHRLARHFCDQPLLAALATLFTPVFLVSSTTVMCDVLMLALWVWAIVLWMEGLQGDALGTLVGAGVLMALAFLTKYFGACLMPLLAVYGLMSKRRFGRWEWCLLIPLLAMCGWQWATQSLYQHALVAEAVVYASDVGGVFAGTRVGAAMTALTFTGGCLAAVMFTAPWLWRMRTLLMLSGGVALLALALFGHGMSSLKGWPRFALEVQLVFWTLGGVLVLALAAGDLYRHRDAAAWMLALWVGGTFVFTAIFNWTINGRSILPMAPAVGILIVRRLQQRAAENKKHPGHLRRRIFIPLAASALLALLVARSECLFADAVCQTALKTHDRDGRGPHTVWFEGHWGFQYYMEELGAKPVDLKSFNPRPGDFLAVPLNNTNVKYPAARGEEFYAEGPRFLAVTSVHLGAGFYSSFVGPLPFAFGRVPPECVTVYH